jgi:hypothetical protein
MRIEKEADPTGRTIRADNMTVQKACSNVSTRMMEYAPSAGAWKKSGASW